MPQLSQITLADALRYFFSPIVLYSYFCVYDLESATGLQQQLAFFGTIAALVSGTLIYFLYRFYLYNGFIRWLHDLLRKTNYRNFIRQRYKLPKRLPWMKNTALEIYHNLDDERLNHPSFRLRASTIHLLYQAGLLAIPFCFYTFHKGWKFEFFVWSALLLLVAAIGMDIHYEDEELDILKTALDKLDQAAEKLGKHPS